MTNFALLFLTAFTVGLSGAVMPGPLFSISLREGLRLGLVAPLMVSSGHSLLELVTVVALLYGAGSYLSFPPVSAAVAFAGGLALLYLGFGMVKEALSGRLQLHEAASHQDGIHQTVDPLETPTPFKDTFPGAASRQNRNRSLKGPLQHRPAWRAFGLGITASISNPYWLLWWATIGAAYVASAQKIGPAGVAAFFTGHISADFAWLGLVGYAAWRGRKLLTPAFYRNLVTALGVFLMGFALYFIYSGVHFALSA